MFLLCFVLGFLFFLTDRSQKVKLCNLLCNVIFCAFVLYVNPQNMTQIFFLFSIRRADDSHQCIECCCLLIASSLSQLWIVASVCAVSCSLHCLEYLPFPVEAVSRAQLTPLSNQHWEYFSFGKADGRGQSAFVQAVLKAFGCVRFLP